MPRSVKYVLYAIIAFGLGAGLALWNRGDAPPVDATEKTASVAAPADAAAEGADETDYANAEYDPHFEDAPAGENPTIELGHVVSGAPEMPEPPASAPEARPGAAAGGDAATPSTTADRLEQIRDSAVVPVLDPGHPYNQPFGDNPPVDVKNPETAVVAGIQAGGAFTLTDHTGKQVTDQSWPGKYKLVFFGFTNCPDICPVTLDKLTEVLKADPALAAKVQPLFITTDPARDTPEVMGTYLSGYHESFVGLTGTEEEIKAVESAYKVYASKGKEDHEGHYTMDHSSYIYLLSPEGGTLAVLSAGKPADFIATALREHVPAE